MIERVTELGGNPPVDWCVVAYFRLGRRDELAELITANPLQVNWSGAALSGRRVAFDRASRSIDRLAGESRRRLRQAIEIYDQLGSRLDLGRLLIYRGWLRQSQGDVESAHADWLHARSIFEASGALRDVAKAQRLLETE